MILTALTLDRTGIVTTLPANAHDMGIDHAAVGRSWAEVFAAWSLPRALPTDALAYPFRVVGTSPTGEPVSASFLRADHGAVTVLLHPLDVNIPPKFQQLCGLGEISGHLTHEINNAITILWGWMELLRMDVPDDSPQKPTLDLLLGEMNRIGMLSRSLMQVSRGVVEQPQELELRVLLDEVVTLVRQEMQRYRIDLQATVPEDLPMICGTWGGLKQAMLNLLVNARQAMPDGGRITLSAERRNGHVCVSVEDTGCGIPLERQADIFRPFFTTKREGTGLGLPITRRIVEDHGGTLEMESAPGRGTRFILSFPAGGKA